MHHVILAFMSTPTLPSFHQFCEICDDADHAGFLSGYWQPCRALSHVCPKMYGAQQRLCMRCAHLAADSLFQAPAKHP